MEPQVFVYPSPGTIWPICELSAIHRDRPSIKSSLSLSFFLSLSLSLSLSLPISLNCFGLGLSDFESLQKISDFQIFPALLFSIDTYWKLSL